MPAQHSKNTRAGSPSEKSEPVYLAVGLLRRPHGVRGEIMLETYTDQTEIFTSGASFYLGDDYLPKKLASARRHKQGILVSFEGIADRDEIGRFRNTSLYAKEADLPTLPDGEFYDHEIIGLEVIIEESGKSLGFIKEILKTGANDVYVIESEQGSDILLPAIPSVVLDIDLGQQQMSINLLDGLLDG